MEVFLILFYKIIPLYFLILLGYLAGKFTQGEKETIATLLIYIISPLVIFSGIIKIHISASTLSLPLLYFCLACLMCLIFYFIATFIWQGSEKNIIAYTSGTGNNGYFGLPVAMLLFGPQIVPLIVLAIFGFTLYEDTLGFYMTARGRFSIKKSFIRVLKLPTIYAFFAGLLVNISGIKFGAGFNDLIVHFQGAYSVLGMMLIGFGIASMEKFSFDTKFIGYAFLVRFLAWPVLILSIIFLDKTFLHFYNPEIYKVMLLLAAVPLAAKTVAFATVFNVHPEKASLAVLLSTLFALFYIPLLVTLGSAI